MRLLTPRGRGGVAVVVAGAGDEQHLAPCLRSPAGKALPLPRRPAPPRLAILALGGEDLDEVLVLRHPESGELELHLHGSPAVLAALERHFGPLSRDAGTPAARLLRAATTGAQVALALEQQAVDFSAWLGELQALPEGRRRRAAAAALRRSRWALALARPARVVLCGRQNAGKSTLMNRLLFTERVLTGAEPGLTRDPVAEPVGLEGYPYELVDTAGEGPARTDPDVQAQHLGRRLRDGALRLLLVDGSTGPGPADRALLGRDTLVLASKADLPAAPWPEDFPCHGAVSCLDPASAPALRACVGQLLRRHRGLPGAGPVGGPAALDAGQLAALRAAARGQTVGHNRRP